jgi:hypothetical protein
MGRVAVSRALLNLDSGYSNYSGFSVPLGDEIFILLVTTLTNPSHPLVISAFYLSQ